MMALTKSMWPAFDCNGFFGRFFTDLALALAVPATIMKLGRVQQILLIVGTRFFRRCVSGAILGAIPNRPDMIIISLGVMPEAAGLPVF
jgi:hypothetical protein